MRKLRCVPMLACFQCIIFSGMANAGDIPQALVGKSINATWVETRETSLFDGTLKHVDTDQIVYVYLGGNGHIFSASDLYAFAGGKKGHRPRGREFHHAEVSNDPRKRFHWRFAGNTLSAVQIFEEGARQINITFPDSFAGCNVDVRYGKTSGEAAIRETGYGHTHWKLDAVKIASNSCSIRDGNVFDQ